MKKLIYLISMLLFLLSPFASALTAQDPYWMVDGQSAGPSLTIDEGDSALSTSGAFYSDDDFVGMTAELKDSNGQTIDTLASRQVDLRTVNGFELVEVNPWNYPGPGNYFVHYSLSDTVNTIENNIQLTVLKNTTNPVCELTLDPIADITVHEGEPVVVDLSSSVTSTDPSYSFSTTARPAGSQWDGQLGVFVWIPEDGQDGVYPMTFRAANSCDAQDEQQMTITVLDNSQSCDLVVGQVAPQTVTEGQELSFQLSGSSSDPITWSAEYLPSGAAFVPNTQTFTWVPDFDQQGDYTAVFLAETAPDCVQSVMVDIHVDDYVNPNTCPVASFDWVPASPESGESVTFTSTSTDADNDVLSYAWDLNDDGVVDDMDAQATTVFATPGFHPVTLTVDDGECSTSITEQVEVAASCVLDVLSVDCIDQVVDDTGSAQFCSAQVDANSAWLGQITVDFHYDDVDGSYTGGTCQTDAASGACTASFQVPPPGQYTVYADAYRNGCVGDHDRTPTDSFQVFENGYQIVDSSIYSTPAFDNERFDFLRAQDIFVRFRILDEFNNPVDGGPVSVELRSSAGGQIDLEPYQHLAQSNGYYYYWTQIPWSHDFFGPSNVITVYINVDDGAGGQRVMSLNILNNPPEIASEGVVVMGLPTDINGYQVSLSAVNPVNLEATFTVNGQVLPPLMEGHMTTLADGMDFHVHDIDYDNDPFTAVVSVTMDDHLLANVFNQSVDQVTSFNMEPFESDVEDYQSELDWSVSGVDPAVFDVAWDNDENTMTLTPLTADGCSAMTLTLTDLDMDTDSMDLNLCSAVVYPACSDGVDNDGDGFVDMDDPGCSGPLDNDESDEVLPECSDGQDNDNDGLVDWPYDPGCSDANDDSEFDVLPQCSDNIDNDNDGLVDMQDPGCESPSDDDEADIVVNETQCSDGLDNDGDGFVDLFDPGCVNSLDDNETDGSVEPECNDGLDNDGDGLVDFPADPGCESSADTTEWNIALPECSDGIDNDGDGLIDFGNDPLVNDPDCVSQLDDSEAGVSTTTECSDGSDNDGDGFIDWNGAVQNSNVVTDTVYHPILGTVDYDYTLTFNPVYEGVENVAVSFHVDALTPESMTIQFEGATHVLSEGDVVSSTSTLANGAVLTRYLQLTLCNDCCGLTTANVTVWASIDIPADPDCDSPEDDQEWDGLFPECSDNADNDGDGMIDWDGHQLFGSTVNETLFAPLLGTVDYQVSVPLSEEYMNMDALTANLHVVSLTTDELVLQLNGHDEWTFSNAGDTIDLIETMPSGAQLHWFVEMVKIENCCGLPNAEVRVWALVDVLPDPDCDSASDDDESGSGVVTYPACSDGLDNDGDGNIDMADPGCSSPSDDDEYNVWPQCADGSDNDGDGLVDLDDPGCSDSQDNNEWNPEPQCSDNVDNDGDGLVDLWDPDCSDENDNSEHPLNPQCSDGIDNDGDGLVDLADPHCFNQYDDMEGEIVVPAPERPWSDQDDLQITRIDVNGYDVEDYTVQPGEYIMLSVSLENTLDVDLDDVHVRVFLDDYALWATKTLDLDSGERTTVNMHVEIPFDVEPDYYDLRITASNDDVRRVKYRHLVVV